MMLTPDDIRQILQEARKRPSYIVTVLEFILGREPTQEEIDAVHRDYELNRKARIMWLSKQPWSVRKHHVEKKDRIKTVLLKRYNVPEWLVDQLIEEVTDYDY